MLIRHAETFGPMLRTMREALGISQAELARRAIIAPSKISKYETCYQLPDFDTMSRILKPLGADVCVAPVVTAKTLRERDEVITAARAWRKGDGGGYETLTRALGALTAAEHRLPDLPDSPYETIRELHDELALKEREIRALRAAVSAARRALTEVGPQ